jgi:methylthioribose-1-phosphate isomerase
MNVRVKGRRRHYRTVSFSARTNEVVLIEQRKLPHAFELTRTKNFNQTARAITNMTVRGAGAIGATAAYGLAQGARAFTGKTEAAFARHLQRVYETLAAARPTAVDLVNALNQVRAAMVAGKTISQKQKLALRAAQQFADDDVAHCEAIGKHGAKLIKNGTRVLTHCNAGWLAFVDIGSATAPMYAAQAKGKNFHVFCDETRPRSQGAALTAWELAQQGVSHEVIADNAAGHLMQRGEIDLVITGSDRTLGRTGEVANKIGTYTKAVLAARHNIPFYVAIPLSTLDWNLKSGKEIPIEERDAEEVLTAWGTDHRGNFRQVRTANPTSPARNPAFDVTPANLITGIITPKGIYKPRDLWRERKRLGFV